MFFLLLHCKMYKNILTLEVFFSNLHLKAITSKVAYGFGK